MFKTNTVDTIFGQFTKTIAKLDALIKANETRLDVNARRQSDIVADIEKMVKDAEANAAEDKKRLLSENTKAEATASAIRKLLG